MALRWSDGAELDLYEIGDYIALDDPIAAERWIDQLRDRARRAALMPNAGRRVPELDEDNVREVFLGNYRIVYRIEPVGILVLAVLEGHRRLVLDR
ncbi:MAG TPA: type II toxin-antitoxin system RelE/ParE family toxin [Kofleriaceae bacterium]|nr:type II toxin-antitoxin system RelE/ParE family toxin [Kofleriaceae bacterium]